MSPATNVVKTEDESSTGFHKAPPPAPMLATPSEATTCSLDRWSILQVTEKRTHRGNRSTMPKAVFGVPLKCPIFNVLGFNKMRPTC
jgi:hypothetical protein